MLKYSAEESGLLEYSEEEIGLLNYSTEESGLLEYSAEERLQASVPNCVFGKLHYDEILIMLGALLSERFLDD